MAYPLTFLKIEPYNCWGYYKRHFVFKIQHLHCDEISDHVVIIEFVKAT